MEVTSQSHRMSDRQTRLFPPVKFIDWNNVVRTIVTKGGCGIQRIFLTIVGAQRIAFIMFSVGDHNVGPSPFR